VVVERSEDSCYVAYAREARERERLRKVFFLVLARDSRHVERKASELEGMGLPFVVICGEKVDHPKVVHREPRGKWDAINFGSMFVPDDADAVALNDVDTEVHGLEHTLSHLVGLARLPNSWR